MIPAIRAGVVTLILCALMGCHSKPVTPAAKQYELRGVIVELDRPRHAVRVKHEDIAGYMRAMTMTFPVRDDAAWNSLAAGGEITAHLNVGGAGDYWLSDIRKAPAPPGKPGQ